MSQEQILLDKLNERELEIIPLLEEGLSNKEIANQLFLAPNTVKWYVKQLNSKLDTSNRHEIVERATELGLLETHAESSYQRPRQNLPRQTTPFIGRDAELDEIHTIIENEDVRLLTILAQGGMGKTRIALEASEQQLNRFPDGVYFVPLQALSDVNNIVPQIATSAGFQFSNDGNSQKEQLLNFLSNKTMLLCIDNWEHLLEGVDLINEILQSASDVKIIATSREKLNLMSETVYVLQGMHYPDWETPEDALEYDAVQLLLQSAQRVKPDWVITPDNLDYVTRVCRLTQGMPLGILLATSWLDVYSLQRICDEIQKSADILETEMRDVPQRQRSIRAVFEHSWERLNPKERLAFIKMSVFRGGCSPSAAEAITGANARILQSLVNKALLLRNREGRYDVHELLRQYTEAELEQSGQMHATRDAHATYYAKALYSLKGEVFTSKGVTTGKKITIDIGNIDLAWEWGIQQSNHLTIEQMLLSLSEYYYLGGFTNKYQNCVKNAYAKFENRTESKFQILRARLIRRIALINYPPNERQELYKIALSIAREYNDIELICRCLNSISEGLIRENLNDQAWHLLEETLRLSRQLPTRQLELETKRRQLVVLAGGWQKYEEAAQLLEDKLEIARQSDNIYHMRSALINLGVIEVFHRQRYDVAKQYYLEALTLTRVHNYMAIAGTLFSNLINLEIYDEDYDLAEIYAQEFMDYVQTTNNPSLLIGAQTNYATIRGAQGLHEEEHQILQNTLRLIDKRINPVMMAETKINLGWALCGLQDYIPAYSFFCEAIAIVKTFAKHSVAEAIFGIGLVISHLQKDAKRAVALSSLAFIHQPSMSNWKHHASAREHYQRLITLLTEKEFTEAWEHGKSLDLETVAQEILDEFEEKNPNYQINDK